MSMSTYLISYPTTSWPFGAEPIPKYSNIILSRQYNDGIGDRDLFLCDADMSVGYPTDARIVGGWENGGPALSTPHLDYTNYIRPIGNAAGSATNQLDLHHWSGHAQRHLQETPAADTAPEYPVNNQPFICTMERRYDDTSGWEGEGWQFVVEFVDPNREPTNRAVGIYSDPACNNYLYTTGALGLTDTGEVDENEDPIFKYMAFNPAGKATVTPEPVYYALLHGATKEGIMNLEVTQDRLTRNFWENNQ